MCMIWARGLWPAALRDQYDGVPEMRVCPEAKKPIAPVPGAFPSGQYWGATTQSWGIYDDSTFGWAEPGDFGSYGTNGYCADTGDGTWTSDLNYEWKTTIQNRANTIPVFMDMVWMSMWPHHDIHNPPVHPDDPSEFMNEMSRVTISRHNKGINVQFLDFSVRKVGLKEELWSLRWSKNWDTNNLKTKEYFDWPEWMSSF